MSERDVTYSDLAVLDKMDLLDFAAEMGIPVTEAIDKEKLINLLLGKCEGCGKPKN